ncbi:MAG: hypothetical protein ACOX3G_01610 [Armatimonadota bacterium]|jgi:hypothetical protein
MATDMNVHPPRTISVVVTTLVSWLTSISAGMIGLRPLVRVLSAISTSDHSKSLADMSGKLTWWQICIVALLSVATLIAGITGVRISATGYRMERGKRLLWVILLLANVLAVLYVLQVIGVMVVGSLILNRV